ncbi:hypothetical protein B9Z65_8432 [Elsinoe australis]|uniref:FAD-binding FR-type domain-containing protein n=1 Tax=Elsinoe australis TaxID=40998 RepID=A0A2P7YDR8_9PEZI|nr:hypothetical protein B9Z65_8432 [Elsinoe australis]
MAFYQAKEWHEGELEMHKKLRVPEQDNPSQPMLSQQAASMLQRAPLLAVGTLDSEGRPWTTLWGGDKGFSQPLGNSIIGIRTPVPAVLDPVVEILVGHEADGEVVKVEGQGRLLSGLTIDLETRKRVKIAGKMVAGALSGQHTEDSDREAQNSATEGLLQLAVKVEESLGNCPKYLNKKAITPAHPEPRLVSNATPLHPKALDLIQNSDLFFLSTSRSNSEMDTNHRGGPTGFVRVLANDEKTVLIYPEYSGNRLYQSLGNMIVNPKAGFCFPDFRTGDCLYLTGTTEILVGRDAANIITRSNVAIKFTVDSARYVERILPLRGTPGEASPYNPNVRFLFGEKSTAQAESTTGNRAKLLKQIQLTPSISRFHFSLSNAATYQAGQYVTFDFSEHLDLGYSHMRDDDPRSLNDDFVRTFTVSSPPGLPPRPTRKLADDEFEITIRKVGVVTDFLSKHGRDDGRSHLDLDVEVKGFGGSFVVQQDQDAPVIGYIAAGVGITPLLPCLPSLDLTKLRLLWTMRETDIGLASDMLDQHPEMAKSIKLFLTGDPTKSDKDRTCMMKIMASAAVIEHRRIAKSDLDDLSAEVKRWYVCTGLAQRNTLLQWLEGQEVLYEDYNF